MRVLYFHQHFSTREGAAGTRSYEMAQALIRRGHQVTMVCGANDRTCTGVERVRGRLLNRAQVDGIDVVEVNLGYSNHQGFVKRSLVFCSFSLISVVLALFSRGDLVFCTSTPLTAGIPGIFAAFFRRKPFVFEVRDLWPELPKAMGVITNPLVLGLMSLLEWCSYRAASGCIALAPGIAKGIVRRAPKDQPLVIVPNGCDLTVFKQLSPEEKHEERLRLRERCGILEDDFVFVFTGAHSIANGLEAVLEAAALLSAEGITKVRFLFIGDGVRKPLLVEKARREGLGNCVFLHPIPKVELASIISSCDASMMILANVEAFYYGTSPNKFFDYISCGLPVLCNYPGWLSQMIEENKCGVVVRPDSAAEFSQGVKKLIGISQTNQEEWRGYSMRAGALAERNFSRDKLAKEFVTFLERFKT